MVNLPNGKRPIGTKWVYMNKKDERGIVIKNKVRLVAQGYTQEEEIVYDDVFAPISKIEAIRLFLAYASFKDFVVYQMDVKSAFLYGKIEEEVYVCQPPGFEDPDFPDRVYKVEKRGKIDKTLFIKRDKGDILLVQVCVDDIIFGSTKKELCNAFEKLMHEKFQMSSIAHLWKLKSLCSRMKMVKKWNVHLYRSMIGYIDVSNSSRPELGWQCIACARYQVNPKVSHLHAVKRFFRYLKGQPKLGLWYPKDSPFDLVAYTDSDYAGASLDRKSTTGGCQFLGCRLISWQCKKQTVVANSTIEAEYVAATSCSVQVLWIQNQLLDYGGGCLEWNRKAAKDEVKVSASNFKQSDLVSKRIERNGELKNRKRVKQSVWNGIGVNAGDSKLMLLSINLQLLLKVNAATHKLTTANETNSGFLNANPVRYALTINPTIYTLCIEQFWATVKAKTVNGKVQLQALVDGKKVIITESTVRRDLQLEDAEVVDCLPNITIFEQLTLMGYEKLSQKLTFYKAFFSP
ncbi:putative ribonuclease H-like domain-containing protein [Tanacetum coccineum]